MKKLIFLSILILFSCSKLKNYKNVDVNMMPKGQIEFDCHKEYSAFFIYETKLYMVETIDEEYNNVWGGLPVTIDFKIVKEISCDTDIQSNKKAYEVKILSIKER